MKPTNEKHSSQLPTLRKIRRACNNELYRTIKRLKIWVPPAQIEEAEKLYLSKVVQNLPYISEHSSNRKLLSDWFAEHVCREIAELWNVEPDQLERAFREAFGG